MPNQKELRYFSSIDNPENNGPNVYKQHNIKSKSEYLHQFDNATTETAIGEVSPQYLYYPKTANRIHAIMPDVRLIVILRNPIDRAYSSFLHAVRDWHEDSKTFREALQKEETRINQKWPMLFHYVNAGFYSIQLKRYFNVFSKEQIKIIVYDDFVRTPDAVITDLFSFVNVDNSFKPDMSVHPNLSGFPKSQFIHRLFRAVFKDSNLLKGLSRKYIPKDIRRNFSDSLRNQNMSRKRMDLEDRSHLTQIFNLEIQELQEILQKDLTSWISIKD